MRRALFTAALPYDQQLYEVYSFLSLAQAATGQEPAWDPERPFLPLAPAALEFARRALWRSGFVHVPDRFLPQPVAVFGGDPRHAGSTGGFPLLDLWWLTPGDWDVF
jgi:hypothetical protein